MEMHRPQLHRIGPVWPQLSLISPVVLIRPDWRPLSLIGPNWPPLTLIHLIHPYWARLAVIGPKQLQLGPINLDCICIAAMAHIGLNWPSALSLNFNRRKSLAIYCSFAAYAGSCLLTYILQVVEVCYILQVSYQYPTSILMFHTSLLKVS